MYVQNPAKTESSHFTPRRATVAKTTQQIVEDAEGKMYRQVRRSSAQQNLKPDRQTVSVLHQRLPFSIEERRGTVKASSPVRGPMQAGGMAYARFRNWVDTEELSGFYGQFMVQEEQMHPRPGNRRDVRMIHRFAPFIIPHSCSGTVNRSTSDPFPPLKQMQIHLQWSPRVDATGPIAFQNPRDEKYENSGPQKGRWASEVALEYY
ncbi:hypothetical protein DFH07DRAFT_767653 [Mycena maculata]|uniref:Uncharacterized protein n=1 Tax=Mycena maculata TaxID=230809 RepID=A0AAD7K1F2_9AGAR|nr:hypothetical protein DFH07DRAFT_767653 [Mycena maculata]